jgi:sec-independent protein translocase protein TatA
MFNIGPWELILILIVALVVVGPKKLPEMGRAVGNGLKEFRKATSDIKNQLDITKTETPNEEKKA